jgi:hypothetical protein
MSGSLALRRFLYVYGCCGRFRGRKRSGGVCAGEALALTPDAASGATAAALTNDAPALSDADGAVANLDDAALTMTASAHENRRSSVRVDAETATGCAPAGLETQLLKRIVRADFSIIDTNIFCMALVVLACDRAKNQK